MFDEDDKLNQRDTFIDESEEKSFSFLRLLIIFFIWAIWTTALSFIFLPKVQAAVEESGVIELIEKMNNKAIVSTEGKRLVKVFYQSLSGLEEFLIYTEKRGSSAHHDAIEALLEPVGENALKTGSITFIDKSTKLIGLSSSKGICYVDLSKEFTNSKNTKIASSQVRETLLSFDDIDEVVILVDGVILR